MQRSISIPRATPVRSILALTTGMLLIASGNAHALNTAVPEPRFRGPRVDGAIDLVTSDLQISLNDGAGGFDQVVRVPGGTGVTAVGDFTQDVKPDIASLVGSDRFRVLLYMNVTPIAARAQPGG